MRTETYSGVFVRGLRIPSRFIPCKTHSREMAQTSGFDATTQVKICFDSKISSVTGQPPSMDRNHFSTPRLVAESLKAL